MPHCNYQLSSTYPHGYSSLLFVPPTSFSYLSTLNNVVHSIFCAFKPNHTKAIIVVSKAQPANLVRAFALTFNAVYHVFHASSITSRSKGRPKDAHLLRKFYARSGYAAHTLCATLAP